MIIWGAVHLLLTEAIKHGYQASQTASEFFQRSIGQHIKQKFSQLGLLIGDLKRKVFEKLASERL